MNNNAAYIVSGALMVCTSAALYQMSDYQFNILIHGPLMFTGCYLLGRFWRPNGR